jgi:Lon protease-like protein
MGGEASEFTQLSDVPLFPLPNVVLFPRAILPLHIFEPRYRKMLADALAGERQIAMALLKGDWQHEYHRVPAIHDVVCIGKIIAHEELEDGSFNVLLEGWRRARVIEENRTLSYRRVRVQTLTSRSTFDMDLLAQREALTDAVQQSDLVSTTLGREISKLLEGPVSTADVADICAFNLLDDVTTKQRLLEEVDVGLRVRQIVKAIRASHPQVARSTQWPRPSDLN